MSINCIALDDEPLALEIIESYTNKIQNLNLIHVFNNPLEALNYIKTDKIDLVFLDIQMDDLNGIQFLNIINEKPLIIFTTAYDIYAIKGFELDIVDYLLKPISFERFVLAIEKATYRLNSKKYFNLSEKLPTNSHHHDNNQINYCFVKTEHKLRRVFFDDILYVEGMGDYLKIVCKTQKILTLNNFKKMEEILPESNFCRVHKSYIISMDKIANIEKNHIYISEFVIPISEKYKIQFFDKLNNITL